MKMNNDSEHNSRPSSREDLPNERFGEHSPFVAGIADMLPDAIVILELPSRTIIYSNRNTIAAMGFNTEDLVDKPFDERVNLYHPADLPSINAFYEHLQQLHENEEASIEFQVRNRRNEWTLISLRARAFQFDMQGYITQALIIGQDVTTRRLTEKQLQDSKIRLEAVVNVTSIALGRMLSVYNDKQQIIDFEYEWLNEAAVRMGFDATGQRLLSLFPTLKESELFNRMVEAAETGKLTEAEFHHHGQHTDNWFHYKIAQIKDGIMFSCEDITERKRQTDEVLRLKDELTRQTEDKYRKLFDSIDQAFCIVEVLFNEQHLAYDYVFLEANRLFHLQVGLNNVTGKTARQIIPDLSQDWFDRFAEVAQTGKTLRFESAAGSIGNIYEVYVFPVDEERSNHVAVLFNNIRERKEVEAALKYSELRFRLLVTASSGMIYRMSANWDAMELLGGTSFLRETNNPNFNWIEDHIPKSDRRLLTRSIRSA
ncbi:MAG: PAS domain-containing protein, partial [Pedobacter sp.]